MVKKRDFRQLTGLVLLAAGMIFLPAMSAHAICPEGMFAYWHLDEEDQTAGEAGGTYADAFGSSDGNGNVNPEAVEGVVGGAQAFDAATETKINVPAHRFFDWAAADSFSIEVWVKTAEIADPAMLDANQILIGRSDGNLEWWIGIHGQTDTNPGKAQFRLTDSDGGADVNLPGGDSDVVLTDGNWHHLVAVRDVAADTITLYVDGSTSNDLTITDPTDADFVSANGRSINIGWLNYTYGTYHLTGSLDEIAIYDSALSVADIQSHFNDGAGADYCMGVAPYVPYPDHTLSHWNLDEEDQTPGEAGGTYEDSYGNNDGNGNVNPAPAAGVVAGAQVFDAAIQTKINVPADRFFDWAADDSFSIEVWVKTAEIADPAALDTNQILIGRSDGNLEWWIGIHGQTDTNPGKAQFRLTDSDGGADVNLRGGDSDVVLTDGNWHHLVAVRDVAADTITLYVDGSTSNDLTITDPTDADFVSANNRSINIGWLNHTSGTYHLTGSLDEIAIYDSALSDADVGLHYDAAMADGVGIDQLRPAPIAEAGDDQTVAVGATVELDGGASSDTYGGIDAWLWEQTDGDDVTLTGADSEVASFTADTEGSFTFELTVTDGDGQQASDSVTVTVNEDVTPPDPGDGGGTPPPASDDGGGGGGCFINTLF